jgi:iron complex outermembrane receptor protein
MDALAGGSDGYVKNPDTGAVFGGRDRQQLRGQLLWLPNADVDVRLIADYLHHEGTINGPVYRVVGPTGAIIAALSSPILPSDRARYVTQIDGEASRAEENEVAGFTGDLRWRTVLGEITAIAAYRSADAARSYDVDNSPADIANDPRDGETFDTYTLEMRLQGEAGRLDYLFGMFLGRESIASRDNFEVGSDFDSYADALAGGNVPAFTGLAAGDNFPLGTGVLDIFRQRSDSFALFTHHIFALSDRVSLTLGGRYTNEEKRLSANITSNNPACSAAIDNFGPDLAGVPGALQGILCIPNLDPRYDGVYRDRREDGNASGTAAITGRLSETFSAYAQYSRGFKGGGYQLDRSGMNALLPALSQVSFGPETANSFEAGLRGLSTDGVWRFATSLFHTAFDNYQFSYFTGLNRRTQNVPDLVTQGFEIETGVRPIPAFELTLATAYQEVQFGDSGFPAGLTQLQGSAPPLAPRWVVVGTASYTHELTNMGLTLFGDVDMRWQSRSNVGGSATPSPSFTQNAYALVGARLGVKALDSGWMLEAWGRNLFDTTAWSILNSTTLQPGSISGYVTDPQTLGVSATVSW